MRACDGDGPWVVDPVQDPGQDTYQLAGSGIDLGDRTASEVRDPDVGAGGGDGVGLAEVVFRACDQPEGLASDGIDLGDGGASLTAVVGDPNPVPGDGDPVRSGE